MRRSLAAAAVCTALLLGVTAARADDEVSALDPGISAIDESITPMATRTSNGTATTIALSSDVLFATGSATISETARARLAELVDTAPRRARVSVDGYADSVPYQRGNDVLSTERAQAVADVIAAERSDLRLTVTGHGESDPVAPNTSGGEDSPEGRAKNRRVEISYDR